MGWNIMFKFNLLMEWMEVFDCHVTDTRDRLESTRANILGRVCLHSSSFVFDWLNGEWLYS